MFVFSLTRRRVHVNDQGFDPHLSQRHGGGNTDGSGTSNNYTCVQVYLSSSRITLQAWESEKYFEYVILNIEQGISNRRSFKSNKTVLLTSIFCGFLFCGSAVQGK
jgi:hypothetical protein